MGLDSVAITTVWVKDVDRALDFYTGTLGLEKGMDEEFGDSDRFVTVAPAGDDTQIAIRPDQEGRAGQTTGIVASRPPTCVRSRQAGVARRR